MDTLELLTTRRSNKKLVAPAPNQAQLAQIFQAALRTPDHGRLHPYHFIVIENDGLQKLATILREVATELQLDEKQFNKIDGICAKPMIIGVVAKINPEISKVPEWEQLISAGCAAYGIQLAAQNLGFDNVWITGKWTEGKALRQAFGCSAQDKIVALLMIGTAAEEKLEREIKQIDTQDFVSYL
ncbi:nitroreductase [Pasteurellaceae bacterium Pebbles2]|nr:nitroreductase [Pasteurellaceae bacterium Pebbles2]